MTLLQKIRTDLANAMKQKDTQKLAVLRYLFGDLQRYMGTKENPSRDLTDEFIIGKFKKLKAGLEETHNYDPNLKLADQPLLDTLISYLPQELTRDEIIQWIKDNIDFSTLKPRARAVGIVKKQFGMAVDGNLVQDIIKTEFPG